MSIKSISKSVLMLSLGTLALTSCKKDKEDTNSQEGNNTYSVPTSYVFEDANGNNTVSYSGQTDRLNQLSEMVTLINSGLTSEVSAQDLKDMYANEGGDGNGNFSFTSTKQLKNKTFGDGIDASTQEMFESFMDDLAMASQNNTMTASQGQAGTLSSGTSTYLFDANGREPKQLIEKGLMGAVFYYQANSYYLSEDQIGDAVNNTDAVDPANGKYYTTMEHHWDEAFGYFGVSTTFPIDVPEEFWGKYCDKQDEAGRVSNGKSLNSAIMDAFLGGRAAISNGDRAGKESNKQKVREAWELVTAGQAHTYLTDAQGYFGSDNAKFLHVISEAWAFIHSIKYSPSETRRMTPSEVDQILNDFLGDDFWEITAQDLNSAINLLEAKYEL